MMERCCGMTAMGVWRWRECAVALVFLGASTVLLCAQDQAAGHGTELDEVVRSVTEMPDGQKTQGAAELLIERYREKHSGDIIAELPDDEFQLVRLKMFSPKVGDVVSQPSWKTIDYREDCFPGIDVRRESVIVSDDRVQTTRGTELFIEPFVASIRLERKQHVVFLMQEKYEGYFVAEGHLANRMSEKCAARDYGEYTPVIVDRMVRSKVAYVVGIVEKAGVEAFVTEATKVVSGLLAGEAGEAIASNEGNEGILGISMGKSASHVRTKVIDPYRVAFSHVSMDNIKLLRGSERLEDVDEL